MHLQLDDKIQGQTYDDDLFNPVGLDVAAMSVGGSLEAVNIEANKPLTSKY